MSFLTSFQVAYILLAIAWIVFWPVIGLTYHDSNERQELGRGVRLPLANRVLLAVVFLASGVSLASPRWDTQALWVVGTPALVAGVVLVVVLLGTAYHAGRVLAWRPSPLLGRRPAVFAGGPFGWLRHPTYVAITVAAWLTAFVLARKLALYATACLTVAHLILIFREERSTRLADPEAYAAYAGRVPMLIPWRFGRAARTDVIPDDGATTGQALFTEAQPVISRRAARAAAKQQLKSGKAKQEGARGKGGGTRNKKGKRKAKSGQGGEPPQPQAAQDPQSRAWQLLQGKSD